MSTDETHGVLAARPRGILREIGLWVLALFAILHVVTYCFGLWLFGQLAQRDALPSFTLDPNPSTETAVVWTRDSAVIRTRALKP